MASRFVLHLVVSYSTKDARIVYPLTDKLKELGIRVWVDKQQLQAGDYWQDEIRLAIVECDILLVVVSANSVQSQHVLSEIRFALDNGKVVVPIRIDHCEMPKYIAGIHALDFSNDRDAAFSLLSDALLHQYSTRILNVDEMVAKYRGWFGGAFGNVTELTWGDLFDFTCALFSRAGYTIQVVSGEETADIHLRIMNSRKTSGESSAYVTIRKRPVGGQIPANAVRSFARSLASQMGYLITDGELAPAAHAVAASAPNVRLVDGKRLRRYLNFVTIYGLQSDRGLLPSPDYIIAADHIAIKSIAETKILAIAQNRGGVGKTTCVAYLTAAFAAMGKNILLIDFDNQASLTSLVRDHTGEAEEPTLADYLAFKRSLDKLVYSTGVDQIRLIPAHHDISSYDSVQSSPDSELEFAAEIYDTFVHRTHSDAAAYDWIVVDVPPSLNTIVRIALASAQYVLIPVCIGMYDSPATENVLRHLEAIRSLMGRGVRVLGGVVTQWKSQDQERLAASKIEHLLNLHGLPLLSTRIPFDRTLAQAASMPQMVEYVRQRRAPGAEAFWALAAEIETLTDKE